MIILLIIWSLFCFIGGFALCALLTAGKIEDLEQRLRMIGRMK